MLSKKFTTAYFVIGILELIVLDHTAEYFIKPLIALSLIGFVFSHLKKIASIHWILILALILAMWGDIALMLNHEKAFIVGLSFFLLMQLLYAYLFFKQKSIGIFKQKTSIMLVTFYVLSINYILLPNAANFALPIFIYSLSIGLMLILAILRYQVRGYKILVLGAILFCLSDSLIAVNKFVVEITYADYLIMTSYILAQYFIVTGYLAPVVHSSEHDG